jgi:hypothetical protein
MCEQAPDLNRARDKLRAWGYQTISFPPPERMFWFIGAT